jgi:mono/diheme cytochrome c family protein
MDGWRGGRLGYDPWPVEVSMRERRDAIGRGTARAAVLLGVAVTGASFPETARAQPKPEPQAVARGAIIYGRYCVSCHGKTGRGDGPLAADLKVTVPDLTTLATRHSGRFPLERVQRVIESGEPVRGHGSSDMPAWGDAFKRTGGIGASTPKEAIRDLAHYLLSLQREDPK